MPNIRPRPDIWHNNLPSMRYILHIYTSGAIFPMLAQVVYIAHTPLCRWYMKHIHQFVKQPIFSVIFLSEMSPDPPGL